MLLPQTDAIIAKTLHLSHFARRLAESAPELKDSLALKLGIPWTAEEMQAMLDAANRFIRELKWRGPFELECIVKGDDVYLIEINPRFPAWIYLSAGAGMNLPEALVRLALGEAQADLPPVPAGVMFIRHAWEAIVTLADFEAMVTGGGLLSRCDNKENA